VTLLDHDGLPTKQTRDVDGQTLSLDTGKDRTPYYLIEFE
jgi:hypothetical protein